MKKLILTNSLGKNREEFSSLEEKKVKLYVCGITPYDYAHIGHGRVYVVFDVMVRFLRMLGYDVRYVRNFTDIDDKLLEKAKELGDITAYKAIAEKFEKAFIEDMATLGCVEPDVEPKVTEHIPLIIDFIKELIAKEKAYVVNHDVYFNIASSPTYGKLSRRDLGELSMGIRVEVDERKKHPADFALWKGNEEGLFWESPWGYGRPGWHVECSALARKYLGDSIDIHGGGMDLIFPHHENEIAQSEGLTGKPFANYWIHNAFVTLDKEKMSKSIGNVISLRDVFKKYDAMVLRFFYLQHHYTKPVDFSFESLDAAQKAYAKLVHVFEHVKTEAASIQYTDGLKEELENALCDDLNTSKFLGIVFANLSKIQSDTALAGAVKSLLVHVLGLTLLILPERGPTITPEIQKLIEERERVRKEKNWKRADEIRDQLREMGIELHDKKMKGE